MKVSIVPEDVVFLDEVGVRKLATIGGIKVFVI